MKLVRKNVFETNSSSTHSLVICTKEEFEKFKKGEKILDRYDEKLVDRHENIIDKLIKTGEITEISNGYIYQNKYYETRSDIKSENFPDEDDFEDEYRYGTYESLGSELESYEQEYTTKSGDEIVVFGEFGYDG